MSAMPQHRRGLAPLRTAAAMAAICLSGLFAPAIAKRPEPIEIAVIGPYTGGSADMGISMRQGAEIAAAEINRTGGLLDRPILLLPRDDAAHNERGSRIAQEIVGSGQVTAAVGLINTGVALAAAPYFEEARIPLMVAVATGATITTEFAPPEYEQNYVFRVSTSTSIEAPVIVDEMLRHGYRKPAILVDATSYGTVGREGLMAALRYNGLAAVSSDKFNIGDTDMKAQLRRAQATGADVLLTYGIGPELAALARGRTALGWPVPIIGSWTLSMSSFIDGAGPSGEGAIMPETFIPDGYTPRQKAFIDAYAARFGRRMPSPVSAAQGYDALLVLAAAIKQAGTTDGDRIRAALEDLKHPVPGVVKTYDHPFDATNHEAIHPDDIVFGVVRDARVVREPAE